MAYANESVDGVRSIFLCRVLVGQYCEGKKDAKVPDVIDPSTHRLFDSTVNYVANPEIFVTYHDAQVYPDCKGLLTLTCNLHQIYSTLLRICAINPFSAPSGLFVWTFLRLP